MDDVGSEIGQKMRSAIKAKLTELGCYVDDELPDYVMVMVANKRTRSQMEDDLQLFLGTNTQLFVNWLHQVLKKLQEVTVSTSLKQTEAVEPKTSKTKSASKEHKIKEKKDKKIPKEKHKKSDGSSKKSKKETKKKEKESRKKVPKKSKKKSKNDEVIRPNVPPLLMNLEKESEPSITDVFAGQILKNHGITLEKSITTDTKALEEIKPLRKALKRNRFPIIDPATVSNVTDPQPTEVIAPEPSSVPAQETEQTSANDLAEVTLTDENTELAEPKATVKTAIIDLQNVPREEQIREMNEIEAKIQGLKKKLADQMDSMSEDEDFLNIRTEAEELMNDFAEDVLQEIAAAQNSTSSTPPLSALLDAAPSKPPVSKPEAAGAAGAAEAHPAPEVLPHIELQLPKRPMRERLGARPELARPDKRKSSDERLTPERPPAEERARSVRTRLGEAAEERGRKRHVDLPERTNGRDDHSSKRLTSKVCSRGGAGGGGGEERARAGPASVVRVRPRPRAAPGAPAPALLMRAVADAHKSLLNVAPKVDSEPQVKRALVLPMRRTVESQNIRIQVQTERVSSQAATSRDTSDCEIDLDTESLAELTDPLDRYKSGSECLPEPMKRSVNNQRVKYLPSHTSDSSTVEDDVIKIHNPTVGKERGPQFVVTLDGLDPNVFLAKKLRTEGLDDEVTPHPKRLIREASREDPAAGQKTAPDEKTKDAIEPKTPEPTVDIVKDVILKKSKDEGRVAVKIEESSKNPDQRVDLAFGNESRGSPEAKRKSSEAAAGDEGASPPAKKRRASPIVFDVRERQQRETQERKKETRERKESVGSDITVTTTAAANHKYDSLPSLPSEKRRPPCRVFPACRFGAACAFSHPRCKFAAACSRRDCVYSHPAAAAPLPPLVKPTPPALASHVVPVGNYKSISPAAVATVCRFYPACVNPGCPYLHPKPCRYGRACLTKHECNFYHHDAATKWRSPFQL